MIYYYKYVMFERMNEMKKIARITSVIALILAVVMCFSGCGLVDFTRSLVSKEPEAVTGSITTQPQTDAPTQQHTVPPTHNNRYRKSHS